MAESDGEAGGMVEVRANIVELLLRRPILGAVFERSLLEYVLSRSPAVSKYVKRISEVTGLPEEVVKSSRPVREYIKSLVGI